LLKLIEECDDSILVLFEKENPAAIAILLRQGRQEGGDK
jgi:hypothetical protein